MRYAITGHTSGIGQHLYQTLSPDIIGFSKSTGYNICNHADRRRILDESEDCDIFINNASDGMGQTQLLIEWFNRYHTTNKVIINVGSRIAELTGAVKNFNLLIYQSEKLILKEMSLRLANLSTCTVIYKWFGYVGTDKILKKYPYFVYPNDYITVDEACNLILKE